MFCTTCGSSIPDNSKFCTNCGASFMGLKKPLAEEKIAPPISSAREVSSVAVPLQAKNRKFCTTCGVQILEDSKFCTNCGASSIDDKAPLSEEVEVKTVLPNPVTPSGNVTEDEINKMFCTNCGSQIPANSKFCIHCGTNFVEPKEPLHEEETIIIPPIAETIPEQEPYEEERKKGKWRIYALAGIVLLILGIIGFLYWNKKPAESLADSTDKRDSSLSINTSVKEETNKSNNLTDTSKKYISVDTARILRFIETIIQNHENATNTKLKVEKRKELTDSLFSALVRRESTVESIQSFLRYFITNLPEPATKISSKPRRIKSISKNEEQKGNKEKGDNFNKFK